MREIFGRWFGGVGPWQDASRRPTPSGAFSGLKSQTHSTQREGDRLLGGHRRAFCPLQFKHDIAKLSAQPGQRILICLLVYLLDRRAKAHAQAVCCRQELNRLFVVCFTFVDLGKQFK